MPSRMVDERAEIEVFQDLVFNVLSERQEFFRRFGGKSEDLYKECSYPDTTSITISDFKDAYDRQGYASRVVKILPNESWKVLPDLFEDDNPEVKTKFETVFEELGGQLMDSSSYRASESSEGNPIWEVLSKADELCGIGRFGGILLGFDGTSDLSTEAKLKSGRKLLFMRPLDETCLSVADFERDVRNPRYGQPTFYHVTLNNSFDLSGAGTQAKVHWTRILHLADNTLSNPWLGTPRMLPVWNYLLNLDKLLGGSAEMYWRGAFPGLAIETHPTLGGDVEIDQTAVREAVQNYFTKLQRYLALTGMSAKSLAPQVVDPSPQIDKQIEAICVQLDCPRRIFAGSERGELASSQDDSKWNDKMRFRQRNHVTPKIIVPFIDRLIAVGVLPKPVKYSVIWPDLDSLTDSEKADIAVKRTMALGQFVTDGIEAVAPLPQFLSGILKLGRGESLAIVAAAEQLKATQADRLTTDPSQLQMDLAEKAAQQKASALGVVGKPASKVKKAQSKQEGNPATRVKQQATKGKLKSQQPRGIK